VDAGGGVGWDGSVDTTIRPAQADDAEALAVLHVRVWDEAYTGLMPQPVLDERRARPLADWTHAWQARLALTDQRTWVALAGAEIVGFAESGRARDGSGGLEMMALYVRSSHYDTGLGHRLLATAIGDEPAYLWVLDGNARAIGFYERHGFAFDGQVEQEVEGLHRRMVRA
jgi:ribosomal protein S18 acetylase RimI-like enzyme